MRRGEELKWAGWNKVYRLWVQRRVKVFLWIMRHDRLLTNYSRRRRGLALSSVCPICEVETEGTLHAVRDCIWARVVWNRVLPPQLNTKFFSLGLRDWVLDNMSTQLDSRLSYPWPETMPVISCCIWKWRNSFVFEGMDLPLSWKFSHFECSLKEMKRAWRPVDEVPTGRGPDPRGEPSVSLFQHSPKKRPILRSITLAPVRLITHTITSD